MTAIAVLIAGLTLTAGAAVLMRSGPNADDRPLLASTAAQPPEVAAAPTPNPGCLPSGDGFFRAKLDGAVQMRVDWSDAQIFCEGMPRPDGNGIRLSFRREDGDPFLVVLGIAGLSESSSGKALPANVTIIEGKARNIYGTLGDDKCTVDDIRQELVSQWRSEQRTYRVSGRGFCMEPALAVGGDRKVLMSTFDFAGQVVYETVRPEPRPEPKTPEHKT